jgi:hypothetical protein
LSLWYKDHAMSGDSAPSASRRRLLPAVVAAVALIVGAPFIAGLRAAVREAFPAHFVLIVVGVMGAAIGVAVLLALVRIRQQRMLRYGAIALALAVGVAYAAAFSSGSAEQDAVERFHFVEYGLVTLLFYRAWKHAADISALALPLLAGVLVGTLEEWFQWFVPVRVGEVKDVFLNLVAIACGLLFSVALDPPARLRWGMTSSSARHTGLLAATVVVAFAAFFHTLHLGYRVHDGEIGTFDSRYSSAELLRLSVERAARWRTEPPVTWRRLSREDQYLTEGLVHVQHRNRMWESGDVAAAWAENRILEKYFQPVLDTPSYVTSTGHRWPPEQREDADRRSAGTRTLNYISDAYPYELYEWPRPYYWAVVITVAGALLVPAAARPRSRQAPVTR